MEELFLKLLQQSPWVAVSAFLIWQLVKQRDATLQAYKEGVASTQNQSDSFSSVAATMQSMERSLGSLQMSVRRSEERIVEVHDLVKGLTR